MLVETDSQLREYALLPIDFPQMSPMMWLWQYRHQWRPPMNTRPFTLSAIAANASAWETLDEADIAADTLLAQTGNRCDVETVQTAHGWSVLVTTRQMILPAYLCWN